MIVKADKTSNFYKIEKEEYQDLLDKSIQKEYKKAAEKVPRHDELEPVQEALYDLVDFLDITLNMKLISLS